MSPRDPLVSLLVPSIGVTSARHHAWTFMWDSGDGPLSFACTLSVFPVLLSSVFLSPYCGMYQKPDSGCSVSCCYWGVYFGSASCPGVLLALFSSLLRSHTVIFPLTGLILPTISSEFWKSVSSASSTPLIFPPLLALAPLSAAFAADSCPII